MSEAKIAPIPDLGTRTDEITIFAGPCSCLLYTSRLLCSNAA